MLHSELASDASVGRTTRVSSTRTLDRLHTLQRQIQPLRAGSPHLRELDERITDFLTRSSGSGGF